MEQPLTPSVSGTIRSFFTASILYNTQCQHTSNQMNKHINERCYRTSLLLWLYLYSSSWENSMKIATLAKMLLTVIFIFSVRYVPVNLSLLLVENPSERSMCAPEQTSRDRLGPFTLPVHQSTKPGQGSGQTGAHSWKKSNTEKKADCATCQLGAWEHEGGSYVNSLRFCQPIVLFHIIVLTRIEV